MQKCGGLKREPRWKCNWKDLYTCSFHLSGANRTRRAGERETREKGERKERERREKGERKERERRLKTERRAADRKERKEREEREEHACLYVSVSECLYAAGMVLFGKRCLRM